MQKQYGPDRLGVLLISVDESYESLSRRAASKADAIFKKHKIDWPNVFEPGGWASVLRKLNSTGYGLILVDDRGIVRGVDIREPELKKLLKKMYPETPTTRPNNP